jgi:hypothetical protein
MVFLISLFSSHAFVDKMVQVWRYPLKAKSVHVYFALLPPAYLPGGKPALGKTNHKEGITPAGIKYAKEGERKLSVN